MDYIKVYKRRLNRYGLDYQSRVQGQRERDFDNYLLKSIYRVDFWYNDIFVPATLERYKQDYTETQCYLLTRRDLEIPAGTILMVESRDGSTSPWMIWWKEEIEASGYNRYVVLRMTHLVTWRDIDKNIHEQWAYFSGPGNTSIQDSLKSSSAEAIYKENNNLYMFVTGYNGSVIKDTYFEIPYKEVNTAYVVVRLDINSTPGVMYVTADSSYIRDGSTVETPEEESAANYWISGGAK